MPCATANRATWLRSEFYEGTWTRLLPRRTALRSLPNPARRFICVPLRGPADESVSACQEAILGTIEDAQQAGWTVPSGETLIRAMRWTVSAAQGLSAAGLAWRDPHVSATPSGEILLEWEVRQRTLVVAHADSGPTYMRAWGPSATTDMDDGSLGDVGQFVGLWRWLRLGSHGRPR